MSDPVPAITEAAATGEIADIFADIRRVLAVDVVNLIWRHLATFPGALPWAWATLRPLYVNGTIAAEAATLHAHIDLPRLPVLRSEVFSSAGLLNDDIVAIRNILDAYDRTNAMAIIALSALVVRLDDKAPTPDAGSSLGGNMSHARQSAIPLPSLPDMTDLPRATAELVLALNRLGTRRPDPILASMYRHLAHWPSYLALAWALIAPLDADGRLDRSIAEAVVKARARAARVSACLRDSPERLPTPAIGIAIRAAVEPFISDVLPKMVVICAVLRAAGGGS